LKATIEGGGNRTFKILGSDTNIMADENNMKSAESTYSSFIGALKWTVPLIAVITAIVLALIS